MSQGNGDQNIPALVATLVITGALLGGGYWFLGRPLLNQFSGGGIPAPQGNGGNQEPTATVQSEDASRIVAGLETAQPNPAVLTIDGSVTLVSLVKQLQIAYTQVNPNIPTTYGVPDGRPNGTNAGLQNLIDNQVLMAFSSRPLNAAERQAGLEGIPIARDALAVVVGQANAFNGSLTLTQLQQIFQGQITNWSEVGGPNLPIRVINRSPDSGTHTFFQDLVLLGQDFAPDGPNFRTLDRDETTPMLQALGNDGIGYSTVQQVVNQATVKILPIEGLLPTDRDAVSSGTYPISRIVYLAVPKQTSPAAQEFANMVLSPRGQAIVERIGFLPL